MPDKIEVCRLTLSSLPATFMPSSAASPLSLVPAPALPWAQASPSPPSGWIGYLAGPLPAKERNGEERIDANGRHKPKKTSRMKNILR